MTSVSPRGQLCSQSNHLLLLGRNLPFLLLQICSTTASSFNHNAFLYKKEFPHETFKILYMYSLRIRHSFAYGNVNQYDYIVVDSTQIWVWDRICKLVWLMLLFKKIYYILLHWPTKYMVFSIRSFLFFVSTCLRMECPIF